MIVTCRYLPEETPSELPTVLHLPLPDLEESNFQKFLCRDEVVDRRITRGELPADLIHELYRRLGGTPGFLENVRRVLRTADPGDLIDDLEGDSPGALSEARESYYERIIAARLYDALPDEARGMVSRLAISELPMPIDGVMRISDADEALARSSLDAGVAFGLLQRFDEPDLPSLYHPPGLLRPWLADPERPDESEASLVHRHLAEFWRSSYGAGREAELRVPVEVELRACRAHAESGEEAPTFRWTTVRLARMQRRRAEWSAARALLEEIPEPDRDADCLLALASVEESLGEWKAARAHLERAPEMVPDGTSQKASTWHQLATIDLGAGDYPAAREKFGRALTVAQAIGDRAGEAAAFFQLGVLAHKMGRGHLGARLVAICWFIDQAIGHGDAESDVRALSGLCSELGHDQAQFDAMLSEAAEAYRTDRGRRLIERAFAGDSYRCADEFVGASRPASARSDRTDHSMRTGTPSGRSGSARVSRPRRRPD